MADPKIEFTIDGEGVSPQTVQWADLREILSGIHTAVIATARAAGIPAEAVRFSLVDIKSKCDLLVVETDPATHEASQPVVSAISSRDDSALNFDARHGLERTWKRLNQYNWTGTLSLNGSPRSRATIYPDVPLFDPPKNVLRGNTSILVEVVNVGGVRPTAKLRLPSGDLITAQLSSRELAFELATKLYKTIQVHAVVTWDVSTKAIRKARITGVGRYVLEDANPPAALKALHNLSGGFWDTVSPIDFINDIRG